ncbi:MAG: type II toxin-antitoxin system VapC family toxin [gamma proteobacterium symbiont of Taylorina sp.]|nr:type II toxin-antitoxin system VapC family toxin [gamma proteobacterium symbiont of Taylorina sp.]
MIAIDTNVLLRYLLDDDIQQSPKAKKIITGIDKILVTDIVIIETVWTLKGKKYKLDKEQIIDTIYKLFEEPNLLFEDGQTIWRALGDYTASQPVKVGNKFKEADFPDTLIVNKALYVTKQKSQTLKCVYTFDKAAQEIPGTEKP